MKTVLLAVCMQVVALALVIFTGGVFPTADKNDVLVNSDTYMNYVIQDYEPPAQRIEPVNQVNAVLSEEAEENKKS